jgi:hypothetical protein
MHRPLLCPLSHLPAAGDLFAESLARAIDLPLGDALAHQTVLDGVTAQLIGVLPLEAISRRDFLLEVRGHLCFVYPLGRRVSEIGRAQEIESRMAQATNTPKAKKRAAGKSKPAGSTAKKGVQRAAKDVAAPVDAAANAALAAKAAIAGTRAAGKAVSLVSSDARTRTPLIAGGSAAAGLFGGLAVIHRRRNGKRTWSKR